MGGHKQVPYTVPHSSLYKIENVPQLKQVQEALARQGLKDPWLRNEAWRYDPVQFGTHASRVRTFFGRGLITGFGLFAATIAIEYALGAGGGHDEHEKGSHH